MSTSTTAHNEQIIQILTKQHIEKVVKPQLVNICKSVAQTLVRMIDGLFVPPLGTAQFPVYTSNLHDATGVGVYSDGALAMFLPTKRAIKSQRSGNASGAFFGSALLEEAMTAATTQYSQNIWIVLFSAVPYAYMINTTGSKIGRGVGYFETLKQTLLENILNGVKSNTAI